MDATEPVGSPPLEMAAGSTCPKPEPLAIAPTRCPSVGGGGAVEVVDVDGLGAVEGGEAAVAVVVDVDERPAAPWPPAVPHAAKEPATSSTTPDRRLVNDPSALRPQLPITDMPSPLAVGSIFELEGVQ
jgi:hypothetical protein